MNISQKLFNNKGKKQKSKKLMNQKQEILDIKRKEEKEKEKKRGLTIQKTIDTTQNQRQRTNEY